jgi:Mg2+ and Co2+ transporter CorA
MMSQLGGGSRATYPAVPGTEDAKRPGHRFEWVRLREPSPEELAAIGVEFDLPGPLVDDLATPVRRPTLEVQGDVLVAVVKTASCRPPRRPSGWERCTWC